MESIKTRGIVAKRREYGESNCMLTLLCDGLGVISASCYGIKSKKSKLRAASQVFVCCDFVLSKKTGDIYRVEAAEIVDAFYPVCEDIVKVSLANYLCDIAMEWSSDDDGKILSLLLNTLYVMAYRDVPLGILKAVFEVKLTQLAGFTPCLDACIGCGKEAVPVAFDMAGGVKCTSCAGPLDMRISPGLLATLEYVLGAESNKLFAFAVTDEIKKELEIISEKYILTKSERSYKSLDYLKKMM